MSLSRRDLWLVPALVVLAHIVVLTQFGWFRDEFYYLACAAHLDYGYVDHPALSILPLWLIRATVGDSLILVRMVPALTMGAAVGMTGLLAAELGGGAFARVLAMTCAAIAPEYLGAGSYYSMNAFDILAWAIACWLLLRALRTGSLAMWIGLGLTLGLGFNNKISLLWLIGGLGLGVIITDPAQLRRRGIWVAGAIAAALFVPYVVWQIRHDWATLEFIRRASSTKMIAQSPIAFLAGQITNMHPATLPVWLAGLWLLLVRPPTRWARALGVMFLSVLALLIVNATSRSGYLAPAYAPLFAAGGCWWESRIARSWTRRAVLSALAVLGLALAPLAMPVLPVSAYIRYAAFFHVTPDTEEKKALADLPQFFADRFGWQELVTGVNDAYRSLSVEEQRTTTIYTSNYGEAGAIDVLGRPLGLPPARSGHNNYWFWGSGPHPGGPVIALLPAEYRKNLEERFESVEIAGTIECQHCMPYENHRPIFICRRPRQTLAAVWARVKHFD